MDTKASQHTDTGKVRKRPSGRHNLICILVCCRSLLIYLPFECVLIEWSGIRVLRGFCLGVRRHKLQEARTVRTRQAEKHIIGNMI